jgi:hypothetical protein
VSRFVLPPILAASATLHQETALLARCIVQATALAGAASGVRGSLKYCPALSCGSCGAVDEPLGIQLRGEPDLGADGSQPQHPDAALSARSALSHHIVHFQERW